MPRSDKGDFTNITRALLRGGVQTLNTTENVHSFLNKNWMYHQLQKIASTNGHGIFPLLEQTYYPSFQHFNACSRFPVVVRVGNGTHGIGKIKIDDEHHLNELEGAIQALGGGEVLVEPFVEIKYDVHLQKIGSEMKAFIRKGISNSWRSNVGSAMLEQIPVTNRHRQWLCMVSEAFGGMDILSLDLLVTKDGREIIHDANDVITFLGDSQEDDRRAIADLIQAHMVSRHNALQQQQAAAAAAAAAAPSTLTRSTTIGDSSHPQQYGMNMHGQAQVQLPAPPPRPATVTAKAKTLTTADQQSTTTPNATNNSAGAHAMMMNGHDVASSSSSSSTLQRKVSRESSQSSGTFPSTKPKQPQQQPQQLNRQVGIKDKETTTATTASASHQDDTMGQLKRTFAGIFGDV
ncbi:unnamed protein product [Anisakis simplex]|uniref:ATP-grasp domain-containing protein n=1 Tax=Anisakis simplex TaxID=6269 RepID=A0A0M3IYI6_ANISI|nr:unnamed protein product [Anisakis simplex]